MDTSGLADRLGPWFEVRLSERGAAEVVVLGVRRLSDGHSSVTLSVDVAWREDGSTCAQTFVVRTRPPGPGLLEPYELDKQFEVMARLADGPVPVPRTYWLEEDLDVIGRPFFVMGLLEGEIIEYEIPAWMREATDDTRRAMSEQIVDTIAAVHNVTSDDHDLDFLERPASGVLDAELRRWVQMVEDCTTVEIPAFEVLADWLRDHEPAPRERTTLLHGDLKWGNFVWVHGRLEALLDWEMVALGDPMIDVGYALMYWDTSPAALPGGLGRDEFIRRYEQATGIQVHDIDWYECLNRYKLAAILARGAEMFNRGETDDLRFSWFGAAVPGLLGPALQSAGLGEQVALEPVHPDADRVGRAVQHILRRHVLPALDADDLAEAQALPLAIHYLAATAAGRGFDIGEALTAISGSD